MGSARPTLPRGNSGTPSEDIALHPVYITRIAGEPVSILNAVDTGETVRLIGKIAALRDSLTQDGQALADILEALVPELGSDEVRAALNVKRAMFNRRAIKAGDLSRLKGVLNPTLYDRIVAYHEAWNRLRVMEESIAETFETELANGTDALLSMLERRNFVDGLSYSNPELLNELRHRLPLGLSSSARGKTRRNLEDSLLQYGARVATKTSPLSSFTMLGVDLWGDSGNGFALEFEAELERRISFKGALFRHLSAAILSDFVRAAQIAPLEINPSAQVQNDRLHLKAVTPGSLASGRFWGTGEDHIETSNNAVMMLIAQIFNEGNLKPMLASDLVGAVCAKAPKLEPAAVWQFLAKLYNIQYLRPALNWFEQDDPMAAYAVLVDKIDGVLGDELRAITARMRQSAAIFHSEDAVVRSREIGQLQADVKATCELLGVEHGTKLCRPVLFENCYTRSRGETAAPADLEPYAADLELLLEAAVLTDLTHHTRCQIGDYFLAEFGANGVCEDVEAFLAKFDDIYGPGRFDVQPDNKRRAPQSEVSRGLVVAADRFHDFLEPFLRGSGDVCIDASGLRKVLDMVPAQIRNRSLSQSYLLQLARDGDQRLAVVNQIFGGRSALMSRFLEVLDEPAISDIRRYVKNGSDTGYAVELPGVFGFNANLHPMLTDTELSVPPFPEGRSGAKRVVLSAIRMVYDENTHSVCLESDDGRRFETFYQGFLIPSLLPSTHRLLALCFGDGPSQFAIATMLMRDIVGPDKLAQLPRLRLGSLVLTRRMWIVPFEQVPDIELPPVDFFVAVQAWREAHGFPNEAFVRVIPIPDTQASQANAEVVDWHKFDFKNIKPFYVRLDSPRFVRLMQRTLKRSSYSVSLTEVLPALDDQHVKLAGEPHVAELQIEMTRPVRRVPPPAESDGAEMVAPVAQDATSSAEMSASVSGAFDNWRTVRIAYFENDRTSLLLGPVREAVKAARRRFGPISMMLQTQWKFGPHLELSFDGGGRADEVFGLVAATIEPWLASNPSREELDPDAYLALSAKLGMSELEPGPYAPLLDDNSLTLVQYRPARALPITELVESKHLFLSDALELTLDLLALKQDDSEAFSLTIIAMMAISGASYARDGLSRGFMSFRSHAEYFFAAYDVQGKLRKQFDALDEAKAAQLDQILQALDNAGHSRFPLPEAHVNLLVRWKEIVRRTAERNTRIVDENHDLLLADGTFDTLVQDLTASAPDDFQDRARAKPTSELGNAFDEEEGHLIQSSPEFMAYRTTVNFFYLLLPTLGVSPLQKFCFCHLLANGAERYFKVSWREIVGLAMATTDE